MRKPHRWITTFVVSAALAIGIASPAQAIWNGQEARLDDFPGIVSVTTNLGRCGGVLLWPEWVLTSKHCFSPGVDIALIRGGTQLNKHSGETATSDKVYRHPNADLALVHLNEPMRRVSTSGLPLRQDPIEVGEDISVAGWGFTDAARVNRPELLQATSIPVCDPELCDPIMRTIGRHPDLLEGMAYKNLLVGMAYKTGVMRGDSGSPMYVNGELAAITKAGKSWSELLTGRKTVDEHDTRISYGVRIAPYAEWIQESAANHHR